MDMPGIPDNILQSYLRVTTLFLMVKQILEIFKTGLFSYFHDSNLYFQFSATPDTLDLHNEGDL